MEVEAANLTLKGIYSLWSRTSESQTQKETLVLQYLGTNSDESVNLSDGHTKQPFVLYKTIKEAFQSRPLDDNTVIEADVILHKKQMFILTSYTIKLRHNRIIGDPITIEEYQSNGHNFNPNASNQVGFIAASSQQKIQETAQKNPATEKHQPTTPITAQQKTGRIADLNIDDFTPIKLVSPSNNSWTICARLDSKGPVRTFKRKDGTDRKSVV